MVNQLTPKALQSKPDFSFPAISFLESDDYLEHAFKYLKKQDGQNINDIFWSRLGQNPSFNGAKVLEFGCGLGNLSVDIALAGADKVVGLDLTARDIEVATLNVRKNYPELEEKVEFLAVDIQEYPTGGFDYILSKDTFEHVLDLEMVLSEFHRLLKPGGLAYIGFGPLWHSPYGFHGNAFGWNFSNKFPWGHLLTSESKFVKCWNASTESHISSFADLGLNGVSFVEYKHIFNASKLRVESLQVNRSTDFKSKVFWLMHHIPFVGKYFAHNVYCILSKDLDSNPR
ncbi:MAG: class I SAM-dependent methyltransferase [Synechococcus sp.]